VRWAGQPGGGHAERRREGKLVILRNFPVQHVRRPRGRVEAGAHRVVQPDPSGANEILFDDISADGGSAARCSPGGRAGGGPRSLVRYSSGPPDGLILKGVNADYLSLPWAWRSIIAMHATPSRQGTKGVGVGDSGITRRTLVAAHRGGRTTSARRDTCPSASPRTPCATDTCTCKRRGPRPVGDKRRGKSTLMKIHLRDSSRPTEAAGSSTGRSTNDPKSVDQATLAGDRHRLNPDLASSTSCRVFHTCSCAARSSVPLPFLATRVHAARRRAQAPTTSALHPRGSTSR